MKMLGVNIKRLREERGVTLRKLAPQLGVSASFLSQVERGKVSPSLATLKKISDLFATTIGIIIGEDQQPTNIPVVRELDRKHAHGVSKGLDVYLLTSPDPNKQMEPLLFKMSPKADSGQTGYKHFGQEFVLVIKGVVEITLNDTVYVLKKGDSIYFNSSVPHSFRNLDAKVSEAVWVITPPTF